jgi:hypothetical protein
MRTASEKNESKSSSKNGPRWLRWTLGSSAVVFATLCALSGCALSDEGSEGADAALASTEQAIGTPGMAMTGIEAWRSLSPYATATVIDTDPALCSNKGVGFFIATRNQDQRYYVKAMRYTQNPVWKQFGARQFVSAPSCAFEEPMVDFDAGSDAFLMAGKSLDNRIYVVPGVWVGAVVEEPPDNFFHANPDWTGAWTQVSATQYPGQNGLPAVGANGSRAVVVFLNSNRIHAHAQSLPFVNTTAAWGARIDGPVLPTGVTGTGVPAITYQGGGTNRFVIAVRGVLGGSGVLYWTYFDGTAFVGGWSQIPTSAPVDSDPSLEWDFLNDTVTVYYRTGQRITQTSAHEARDLGVYPYHLVDEAGEDTVVLGAPRAVFGASIEVSGIRGVIARGWEPPATEANHEAWVLHAQDNTLNLLQCESGDTTTIWNESDVDCGGDLCAPCEEGRACNVDPDCESRNCDGGICEPTLPTNPCAAYCAPATPIAWSPAGSYQSGNLGTSTTCREVTQFFNGMWCGNFAGTKQLRINGTTMNCAGGNVVPPPPAAGGYCIQSTAGNYAWASYSLWDTTQGATPLP